MNCVRLVLFLSVLGVAQLHASELDSSTVTNNSNLDAMSTTETTTTESQPQAPRRGGLFSFDLVRASISLNRMKLRNPAGFDVSRSVYENGEPEDDSGWLELNLPPAGLALSFEKRISTSDWRKRLLTVVFDQEDYEGLEVKNLLFGVGLALSPPTKFTSGWRFAGGVNMGLTRASSYFDNSHA